MEGSLSKESLSAGRREDDKPMLLRDELRGGPLPAPLSAGGLDKMVMSRSLSEDLSQDSMKRNQDNDFNRWLDQKLKINCLYVISKHSDLDDDWQWLQDHAFEFINFYQLQTIEYICGVFKKKWLSPELAAADSDVPRLQAFIHFKHTSSMII